MMINTNSPGETFEYGEGLARCIEAGDIVLLYGSLGAGKTLLTKGILAGLGYDVDEVTSPSFTLVNLYKTDRFDVYHIDLWRLDGGRNAAEAVGFEEILEGENFVAIIEWADRLGEFSFSNRAIKITLEGDGDEPRRITVVPEIELL